MFGCTNIFCLHFEENPKTTLENILQPHRDATEKRIAEQQVVLFVQDTTELDLTRPEQQIRGVGPIGSGSTRRGAYLHLLATFTPDGTPLGNFWNKMIVRKDETPEDKALKKKNRAKLPMEDKESYRWLEGYRETIEAAKRNEKTTCICIGDSESDIFEVFAEQRGVNAHLIVRSFQARDIENDEENDTIKKTISDAAYATSIIATKTLSVRARPPNDLDWFATRPRLRPSLEHVWTRCQK